MAGMTQPVHGWFLSPKNRPGGGQDLNQPNKEEEHPGLSFWSGEDLVQKWLYVEGPLGTHMDDLQINVS